MIIFFQLNSLGMIAFSKIANKSISGNLEIDHIAVKERAIINL